MSRRAARLLRADRSRRLPQHDRGFGYSRSHDVEQAPVPAWVEGHAFTGRRQVA